MAGGARPTSWPPTAFPIVAVQLGRDVADPTGTAARAYALADGAAVLVRPDGHIAWRTDAPSSLPLPDLAAAVHAALGRVACARAAPNLTHRKEHTMTSTTTTHATRGLTALVTDLDRAVRGAAPGRATVDAVAAALRPALGDPQLLRPTSASVTRRRTASTCCTSPTTARSRWLPWSGCPARRHRSTTTSRGAWSACTKAPSTRPDTPRGRTDVLVPTGSAVAYAGDVDGLLPPGDIHRVTNAGTDLAISLHVYGADLSLVGSSIRRRYDDALVG